MKTSIKLIVAAAAMSVAAASFAANTGAYVGVNAGYGKVNESVNINGQKDPKQKAAGFSYGLNGGYMFNQYFGLEMGATKFSSVKFNHGIKSTDNFNVYAAAKGVYPVGQSFNVFGKLGLAYVHTKFEAPSYVTNADNNFAGSKKAIRPFVAAGVGYSVTQNIGVDFQVAGTTKAGENIPAMYNATVGVSYKF